MIAKLMVLSQVGSTTMMQHFITLLNDISPDQVKLVKKEPNKIHKILPGMFKIPSDLLTNSNNSKTEQFFQKQKSFVKTNGILSFSFVRHPFER